MVYVMRRAVETDREAVFRLLSAREQWAQGNDLVVPESLPLDILLAWPGIGKDTVLMVLTEDDEMLGCVTLTRWLLGWGWTARERAEPALSVGAMYTCLDQQGSGLGRIMTLWLVDYAARCYSSVRWLRCTVPGDRLARHFREGLGWQDVRVTRDGDGQLHRAFRMQQRPRPLPGLQCLVAGEGP
ncbi:hypothetical protein ABZ471_38195 [Streptomyces sp. NPDC005728]|uniref:hypothetical protein n=1 Tax=Streptomyces sp. NPDC005728 TaxID=3157054 RepID=UPI003407F1BA